MLWVVALVLFDVFTVTVRRVMFRRDPAAPDRAHVHHLLLRRGFNPPQALAILLAASAALGAIGVAGWRLGVPERWLFAGFVAVGLVYLAVFLFPARFMRWGRVRRRAGS
jgi:UDP-GlcNAc:undecaprenyl-phosphate GlcNAc-1-phosphate transferase